MKRLAPFCWPLFVSLLGATGCMGGVRLQVLTSAPVSIPAGIQKVVVVDRSAPRNIGQGLVDALEGVLTGEDIRADRDGAQAAVRALEVALSNSPRFEVLRVNLSRQALDSSPGDRPAGWDLITRICQQAGCDGVVALEAFDSNAGVISFPTRGSSTSQGAQNSVRGTREVRVTATLRFYDARSRQIVDEVIRWPIRRSFSRNAPSADEARAILAPSRDQIITLGQALGRSYGRRVAPAYRWVQRAYYSSGDPLLKRAKRNVRASDWPGAVRLWAQLAAESPDPQLRGKAHFNLALASERTGDLAHALELATQAALELGNARARSYRRDLDRRLADAARLEGQMEAAAPKAPAAPAIPPAQPAGVL